MVSLSVGLIHRLHLCLLFGFDVQHVIGFPMKTPFSGITPDCSFVVTSSDFCKPKSNNIRVSPMCVDLKDVYGTIGLGLL